MKTKRSYTSFFVLLGVLFTVPGLPGLMVRLVNHSTRSAFARPLEKRPREGEVNEKEGESSEKDEQKKKNEKGEADETRDLTIRKKVIQHKEVEVVGKERESVEKKRGESLSLKSALQRTMKNNPEMEVFKFKREEAVHKVKSAQGALLPKVILEGNAFVWDNDVSFDLSGLELGEPPDTCPLPIGCMEWFGGLFDNIDLGKIRDQFTAQITVTVAQPITALFALLKKLDVEKLGIDLVELERQTKSLALRYEVERAYLQVLMAQRYHKIAKKALRLVKAHEKQVKIYHEHEVVGRAEVLRVEVALRNAVQRITKIEAAVELASANLNRLMGEPNNKKFLYTEVFADPPKKLEGSLEDFQKKATKNRPELEIVRKKKQQARAGRSAMRIMLLPEVTVLGRYQFSEGMGAFTPRNQFFAGLMVSWTWEWGSKYRETKVMESKIKQAEAILKNAERGICLQVRKHYLDVKTSAKNLKVAKAALKAAEENLRIQQLKMGQQMKTVTDLLDAQTRFEQADAQVATTLYKYYLSLAGLKQAVGMQEISSKREKNLKEKR